jgi:hypothetical protein
VSNTLFQPSKLAAASFGLGIAGFLGLLVSLVTGAALGAAAQSSNFAPGAAAGFFAAAVMGPAAVVTGLVAKMRGKQPGWWSTVAILLGAGVFVLVVVTFVYILAVTSTKS